MAELDEDMAGLAALIRTLRSEGVSHFEGTVPPLYRRTVKLGLRPLPPPAQPPDEPAPAKEEPTEKPDPIAALEKRLFGVNGA